MIDVGRITQTIIVNSTSVPHKSTKFCLDFHTNRTGTINIIHYIILWYRLISKYKAGQFCDSQSGIIFAIVVLAANVWIMWAIHDPTIDFDILIRVSWWATWIFLIKQLMPQWWNWTLTIATIVSKCTTSTVYQLLRGQRYIIAILYEQLAFNCTRCWNITWLLFLRFLYEGGSNFFFHDSERPQTIFG